MKQNSLYGIITAGVLCGLFLLAFYNFTVGLGVNYGVDIEINDDYMNLTGLDTHLDNLEDSSKTWDEKTKEDNPFTSGGDILLFGLWDTVGNMWNSVGTIFNLMLGGMANVLHVPVVVLGVIVALFTIGLIFAGWRMIKSGE